MSSHHRVSVFAVLLLMSWPLFGQRPTPRFRHLTLANGLPESSVTCILQDHRGFIWLGTQNGLVRYDGAEFRSYKPDAIDVRSLSGRHITAIRETSDGLWVGTRSGGLNRFDPATGEFSAHRHRPNDPGSLPADSVGALLVDRNDTLWVGSGPHEGQGVVISRYSGHFEAHRIDPSADGVVDLRQDAEGTIWVATGRSGLFRFDPESGESIALRHDPGDPSSLPDDRLRALAVDAQGDLWVGAAERGLARFEAERGIFERLVDLSDPRVLSLEAGRDGVLWVGTRNNVLHRFETESGRIETIRHDAGDPASLSDGAGPAAIFEDRTGTLWVSEDGVGLDLLNPYASKFHHYRHDPDDPTSLGDGSIQSLAVDRQGALWVGTSDGLSRIEPSGEARRFTANPADEAALHHSSVHSLLFDRQGLLWVGTTDGLQRLEGEPQSFVTILEGVTVFALLQDRRGRIWAGTGEQGIRIFDPKTRETNSYRSGPAPDTLGDDRVRSLLQDRRGNLWVGTEGGGLNLFQPSTQSFRIFTSSLTGLEVVLALHEDRSGRLWAGTRNGGLHLIDGESGTRQRFSERDGLAHDSVFAIEEDDSGRLWLATGNGLSTFDPGSFEFRRYDTSDGLLEPRLSGGSASGPDGTLYFGGPRGIQAFRPEQIEDDPHPPPVAFTGLRIFNETVVPGGGSPLARHIEEAESIQLGPQDRVFTLEFAALHFAHPGQNRFAFRLDPFDADWNQVGPQRQATYTNLPPGEYRFRVKAANSDGVWNEEGAEITVLMSPPWWRTAWAGVGFTLSFLLLIGSVARVQHLRGQRREQERSLRREARLRTEAAEAHARAAETEARAARAESERQARELEAARELQLSMLPETLPEHPGLRIAATMQTATEVGGDYYDFDLRPDQTLVAVIGDAAGHGLRAGMMVMTAKSLFASLAGDPELITVLERGNRILRRMRLRRLNMALALVRIRGDRLEAASAGIPPLLLYRGSQGLVWEVGQGGVPLGSLDEPSYHRTEVPFEPGNVVLLMSDGFPELRNQAGEPLGYERAREAFQSAARHPEPEQVVADLVREARAWSGGRVPDDDMTFVVIRRVD